MNERDRRVGRLTKKVTIVLIMLAIVLTASITVVCYIEFTDIVESKLIISRVDIIGPDNTAFVWQTCIIL